MNLPTDKVQILGRLKMFKCWKGSKDFVLVGFMQYVTAHAFRELR